MHAGTIDNDFVYKNAAVSTGSIFGKRSIQTTVIEVHCLMTDIAGGPTNGGRSLLDDMGNCFAFDASSNGIPVFPFQCQTSTVVLAMEIVLTVNLTEGRSWLHKQQLDSESLNVILENVVHDQTGTRPRI